MSRTASQISTRVEQASKLASQNVSQASFVHKHDLDCTK